MVDIYSRLGVPAEILTDQGKQFTSDLMKEVSRLLCIRQLQTTPYHPACNGLVERFNGSLKAMLRKMCEERPKGWDRYLPSVLFAYCEVPQESTGFSPFELMHGRCVRGPMSILKELWVQERVTPEVKSTYQYVLDLQERLEKTHQLAREELQRMSHKYRKHYNAKTKSKDLKAGDKVLLLLPTDSNKLLMHWKGPFDVVERRGKVNFLVDLGGRKCKLFHANLLKRYFVREEKVSDDSTLTSDAAEVSLVRVCEESEEEEITAPLPLLKEAQLTVKKGKCNFGLPELEFLGHRLGRGLRSPTSANTEKITKAPAPKTKKQVRAFLGLTGYYRNFIPNYATIAAPLTDLTRKGTPDVVPWGEMQQRAFVLLKAALASSPILQLPDLEKEYTLRTDASDTGLGAILMQDTGGLLLPVAYASRKLLDRERAYSTTEKEALALVWGIQKFGHYLFGRSFNLETDHSPLAFIQSAQLTNSRVFRWAMFLQNYRFRISAIPGKDNVGADYLSRE